MNTGDPVQQWCSAAADVLSETADRAGRLSVALTTDWLDDHGRGWAQRVASLRRELADAALQADVLAAQLQDPDDSGSGLAAAIAAVVSTSGAPDRGPRLADTSGARVGDEHGVQIPELPDGPS